MRKIATPWFTAGLLFVVSVVCAAQNGTVETVGPLTDNAVPEGVRQVIGAAKAVPTQTEFVKHA